MDGYKSTEISTVAGRHDAQLTVISWSPSPNEARELGLAILQHADRAEGKRP